IDLNAPGGIADYVERFGPLFSSIVASRAGVGPWDADLAAPAIAERRALLAGDQILARQMWRDRRMMALAAHHRKIANDETL
ncbi:MAG: 3-hydroxyacyl-CoA dehydrogenase, partial [Alphaproteobacteria bacterium]|nr:3-hydroxyacyl-CoA dehydrogenase [Alphaproteobacteria bacterium]